MRYNENSIEAYNNKAIVESAGVVKCYALCQLQFVKGTFSKGNNQTRIVNFSGETPCDCDAVREIG